MPAKRVLSVGQCLADRWSISRMIKKHFDAEVESAHSASEALALLRQGGFGLVLVNRVFDADGASGLELIRQLKGDEALKEIPIMLVSNYEDPQRQAVEMGAVTGFGKGALWQPRTIEQLKMYLG